MDRDGRVFQGDNRNLRGRAPDARTARGERDLLLRHLEQMTIGRGREGENQRGQRGQRAQNGIQQGIERAQNGRNDRDPDARNARNERNRDRHRFGNGNTRNRREETSEERQLRQIEETIAFVDGRRSYADRQRDRERRQREEEETARRQGNRPITTEALDRYFQQDFPAFDHPQNNGQQGFDNGNTHNQRARGYEERRRMRQVQEAIALVDARRPWEERDQRDRERRQREREEAARRQGNRPITTEALDRYWQPRPNQDNLGFDRPQRAQTPPRRDVCPACGRHNN